MQFPGNCNIIHLTSPDLTCPNLAVDHTAITVRAWAHCYPSTLRYEYSNTILTTCYRVPQRQPLETWTDDGMPG